MTLAAHLVRFNVDLDLRRERWELPDGDFVDLDRLDGPLPDAPVLLVCHGLEGSSKSGYVRGVMARARLRGLSVVALNFRGCGGESNRLARGYHSGETGDLAHVIERLAAERTARPMGLVGFSLGGNVVTKYLGERGHGVPKDVRAAAVVSVPFDLAACCDVLDANDPFAVIYRAAFLRTLLPKAIAKARRFPGSFDLRRARFALTLREYDDAVTAPIHGFSSADDYYARSSSGPFLPFVMRPLLVVAAEDDPFIPPFTIPRRALAENPMVRSLISRKGGHVGFIEGPPWGPERWAEDRVVEFVAARLLAS